MTDDYSACYLRPGYTQEREERDLKRLQGVLQALRNCHQIMGMIGKDEHSFQAQEHIGSAYQHVMAVYKWINEHSPQALPPDRVVDVAVDDSFDDELLMLE